MARKAREEKVSVANFVGLRVSPDLLAFLDARRRPGEARGAVARECLGRYQVLLAHGLREIQGLGLTEDEVMKVMEALNGVLYTPQTAHLVWADLADRLGDEHSLTQKIRSLSPAGRFALVDVAERFWKGDREALREIIRE
ncbi:hypothetical protein [Thermoflexus sp.]|jgi:hypothetical protein|uniref:hypothetical protein n=1 Tax=Thermoflexus sp. TaxID=1969742 RepID=UPI00261704EA|nr:hypothetical protein [Thermoflexus sp.]